MPVHCELLKRRRIASTSFLCHAFIDGVVPFATHHNIHCMTTQTCSPLQQKRKQQ